MEVSKSYHLRRGFSELSTVI